MDAARAEESELRPSFPQDLGHVDADGWLFVTGRLKECINSGGETISPAEVEAVLCTHPMVQEAMVFAAPHTELHEVVAVALTHDSAVGLTQIQQHLLRRALS